MIFANPFHVVPNAFGLSVSTRNVKFAYLRKRGRSFDLLSFGEHTFAKEGIVREGVVASPSDLAEEIRTALKSENAQRLPEYAVISLPEEEIFLRVIQVPKMSEQDLREAIKWEAEANIPLSIENVYYDYHVLPAHNPKERHDHLDVLVAAIPRTVAAGYMRAVTEAGIRPLVLEPESTALARDLVSQKRIQAPVLILDIGHTRTRLAVFSGENVRFTSFLPFSVSSLVRTLASEKSRVPAGEAERLLFEKGLDASIRDKDTIASILQPELRSFADQIKKYAMFYDSNADHERKSSDAIARVLIAGGGALIPRLDNYLTSFVGIPTSIGDPWANLAISPQRKTPPMRYRDAVRFAPVLGLAMRGANLHTIPSL